MGEAVKFVDAHIHLWELDRLRYPWLTPPFDDQGPNGSVAAIAQDYDIAHYRADLAGWNLAGAVHIEAGADPAHAIAETEWIERIADENGLPNGIVAFAALEDAGVEDVLAAQAGHARVRGIRQIVNWHPDAGRSYTKRDLTCDERWQRGFARLARYGLSFDLQCYPGQMPALAALIERHPEIPVIVNHMGMPVLTDMDGVADWRSGMRALAAIPHVAVKLSGMGFIRRDWTAAQVRPFLAETLDLFGAERCLVASDVPTDKLFASVDRSMEIFTDFAADLTTGERQDLFGRNTDRLYRLELGI